MTHLSSIALLVSLVFLGCGPAPGAPAPKPRVRPPGEPLGEKVKARPRRRAELRGRGQPNRRGHRHLHGPASDGQAQFAESSLVFPSLGARPAEGVDARLYDAITSLPKGFHVGVTTSAGRDAWRYKGTKVITDKDTSTETFLWAEDLEIDWRLE